jgi:hypothetical protein
MSSALSSASVAPVEAALARAVALVQDYAAQDPAAPHSCWRDPTAMFAALNEARTTAQKAWQVSQQKSAAATAADAPVRRPSADLRVQFMDMITTAFADVLEEMKESAGDTMDVDVLVDCLQSGLEILSPEDQEFWALEQDDSDGDEADMEEEDVLTPHEQRRRERGFHVETTA